MFYPALGTSFVSYKDNMYNDNLYAYYWSFGLVKKHDIFTDFRIEPFLTKYYMYGPADWRRIQLRSVPIGKYFFYINGTKN
jgi:hypothetical protein